MPDVGPGAQGQLCSYLHNHHAHVLRQHHHGCDPGVATLPPLPQLSLYPAALAAALALLP